MLATPVGAEATTLQTAARLEQEGYDPVTLRPSGYRVVQVQQGLLVTREPQGMLDRQAPGCVKLLLEGLRVMAVLAVVEVLAAVEELAGADGRSNGTQISVFVSPTTTARVLDLAPVMAVPGRVVLVLDFLVEVMAAAGAARVYVITAQTVRVRLVGLQTS